jgi:uncharacterized protein (TIGR00299 family) protein
MGHEGHDHDDHEGHPHDHGRMHDLVLGTAKVHDDAHASAPTRPDLTRGAGAGKVLFLDAPSGLAGDMIIAALVDLGVPANVIESAVATLGLTGFHLHFGTRVRSSIVATAFDVHVDAGQPTRTYGSIRAMIDAAPLADGIKTRAQRTFRRLAEAEAKVHRTPIDDVHFHEVGAVDAIVDVVGSAAALDFLGAELVVSPLPMGRGFTKSAHGTIPLPPPAVVECLAGFPTYDAGIDFEFVTPTGAAIVGAHASSASRWPSFSPSKVGWGAGTADLKDRPNVLRAILGDAVASTPSASDATATHVVLEANVDDATGELAATWVDSLLAAGALDAWAVPIVMKKGRPALTVAALAHVERADAVAHAMLRETTSLGVRRTPVSRVERPRRMVTVETPYGPIPVKIAEGPFGPPQAKPELDACLAAARSHGVPVREVVRIALVAVASQL